MIPPKELADRYVAVRIEPDIQLRRKAVCELWAEDGVQILEPPQEVRETAATLGMTPTITSQTTLHFAEALPEAPGGRWRGVRPLA